MTHEYQAAIVGGGPAGLQAALTLGRMHVDTVVFDDARYRNASSVRMGNVLGWQKATPEALRSAAHADLATYPWVRVVRERVESARWNGPGLVLAAAGSQWRVERLLITSGVEDHLLPIPGLRELWGDVVLPCPYCHGHEFAPGPIAVISDGSHAEHVSGLLRGLSSVVPVFAPGEVAAVTRSPSGVSIVLRGGGVVEAACVFIPPNAAPRSAIADDLSVHCGPGGIAVDALGRTSRAGVWAAGDVAERADLRIPAAVITAMASGLTAAADIAASVATARVERLSSSERE
ncbi:MULTISPECIES: NAD(P)/FAD-dependent oxidoreductase [Subtercola]|uniref:NAD(P)/FAD-dependent oxidoreductase n=1 Tax=Subtercola vilae TaxID=2056433 RepID=A0A4T2BVE1_9MICO|nr:MULTISPECIES: NAD(P)/FAD-dependent oxidoreductase [Subtercola]MEA9985277.1 NAD(P)/FAD-dependent oxidoreductase [Subtercola sp. RTI3]TIH35635.1 NAD(P)/FAD-dependent oxidoreductase [Subtercola vilae]